MRHVRCAHVRHPAMSSQRARASTVGKTPSFSFCQVDMYAVALFTNLFQSIRVTMHVVKT